MAFRFSLQKILDIKLHQLAAAEKQEAFWKDEVGQIEQRIELLRLSYLADREALNTQISHSSLTDRPLFEASLEAKKEDIMRELRSLNAAQAQLAEWAERALVLRKKTKGLEKVKARRVEEFHRREEEALQKEMDNRAALRAWRSRQEDGSL